MYSQTKPKIIILEDDKDLLQGLIVEMEERGFDACGGASWAEIDESFASQCQYAVIDQRLKYDNGLNCLKKLKSLNEEVVAIILTGYGSIPSAVESMKEGALSYLTKPASTDEILDALFEVDSEEVEVSDSGDADRPTLAMHDHNYIEYVLAKCNGNITHAADWLGIRRQSLQRKLKKFPPLR